jgi:lipopolysaccharide export system permease protein
MVAVRNGNGINIRLGSLRIKRQRGTAFGSRMRAGVQQHPVPAQLHQPGAGANGIGGVEIGHAHAGGYARGAGAASLLPVQVAAVWVASARMRLLDRYLLRELLGPLVYCTVGFYIFWMAFNLFTEMDAFQKQGLDWQEIAHHLLLRTPGLMATVLPISLLLALLYCLTTMARHNEIIAMRAAGRSLVRISVPLFAVALLLGAGMLFVLEYLAPDADQKADRQIGQAVRDENTTLTAQQFRDDSMEADWFIEQYNLDTGEMLSPNVEWREDGRLRKLSAASGKWLNGGWVFYDAQVQEFDANTEDIPNSRIRTNILTGEFEGFTKNHLHTDLRVRELMETLNQRGGNKLQLSLAEIRMYLQMHEVVSEQQRQYLMTQYHGRLAQPWTFAVVVLVALPFGCVTGRQSAYVGVASSIGICFLYHLLTTFGLAFGTSGALPPVLAAWLPNILFGTIGSVMLWRVP